MKIILFGGSGSLGSELKKINPEIITPSHNEVDIRDVDAVSNFIITHKPDLVINAAAIIDNRVVEKFPEEAIMTNIIGAGNISIVCRQLDIRLVYLSTDYIYKGDRGNYKETDEILPYNKYAWTKLGGECSTVCVKNHLIVRTSFGKSNFNYHEAFTDKWASKDYVDVIAPLIYQVSVSPLTGVINVGTERKSLYDYAVERNPEVLPVKLSNSVFFTPSDTSLNLQKLLDYQSESNSCKPHTHCRVCGNDKMEKYLDLGIMPLPNSLEFTSLRAKDQERFPLQVLFCPDCMLSQLSVIIDPGKMFSYYTYRSAVNGGYKIHCQKMAESLHEKYELNPNSFHVDIAGNDGTLLQEFKNVLDHKVLNIDPATNLTAIARANNIPSLTEFWSSELAFDLASSGQADLITATNVFAHVDDVNDFIRAAGILLKPTGVLVLEFPYLIDFIDNNEFDTIYFEHLSYFSITPIKILCSRLGMEVIEVEKQNIHGGTVRVTIAPKGRRSIQPSVDIFCEKEKAYHNIEVYKKWEQTVKIVMTKFSSEILKLKLAGNKIAAFAASAKGNTLLNSTEMNTDIIRYILDETPEKIGKFSPGTGIPIVNIENLVKDPPDYLIILSWNFKEEIISKLRKMYKGKYIIPIPNFEIID